MSILKYAKTNVFGSHRILIGINYSQLRKHVQDEKYREAVRDGGLFEFLLCEEAINQLSVIVLLLRYSSKWQFAPENCCVKVISVGSLFENMSVKDIVIFLAKLYLFVTLLDSPIALTCPASSVANNIVRTLHSVDCHLTLRLKCSTLETSVLRCWYCTRKF